MQNRSLEIKWGITFSIALLIWTLLERLLGFHDERIEKHAHFSVFFSIVAFLIYFLALRDKRKQHYNGYMSWKQGFISGLFLTLTVVILSPLTQYLTHTFISPEYFPNVIRFSIEEGEMTREQAQEYFSLTSYIIRTAIFALFSGIFTSAIIALLVRKRKPQK